MSIIMNILFDLVLIGMFIGFYALGVSVGRAATQQSQKDENIAMEHTHGEEKKAEGNK